MRLIFSASHTDENPPIVADAVGNPRGKHRHGVMRMLLLGTEGAMLCRFRRFA